METPTELFSCAPDVSPEDVWGDAACLAHVDQGPAVVLPPKRVRQDKSGRSASETNGDGGIRIGSRTFNHSASETLPGIEVREIHGAVVRLQPEDAETERMPRHIAFHEKPDRVNEIELIGEAREWGRSKKRQPVFWMLGTGAAVATMVVGAVLALPRINKANETKPGTIEPGWVVEAVADGEAMAGMLSHKAGAGRVLREFLTTPSVEAVMPLVRNPGETAGLIRENRRMPVFSPDSPPLKIDSWSAVENQSLTYGILSGTLPDHSKFETYFTMADGRLALDWKASAAYGTTDFTQLMRNHGDPAEIRGWIEPVEFYSLAFSENSHQAYQLASPDKQQVVWTYARRGSAVHQSLRTLIKGGYIIEGRTEPQKVTVRLAPGPAGALPGQWEIVELLHKEWIAP